MPAKESAEDYEREIARREALAERVAAQQQAEITFAAHQAGLNARRETMREGLLFRIPALPFGRPLARIPPGLVYKALPMYNRPYTL